MSRNHQIVSALFVLVVLIQSGCRKPAKAPAENVIESNGLVTIIDVSLPSSDVGGMLLYRVILPRASRDERLPVLYLLHGIESGPDDIMAHSQVVSLAAAARLVVVMPEAGYSYYTDARYKSHARWEDAITGELRRDVAARFPILQQRERTGIAGISMGGYGAIKLALKHPELYSFAGDMSAPLDITRRAPSFRRWGQTWRTWMIFGISSRERRAEDVFELLGRSDEIRRIHWFESCGQEDPLLPFNRRLAHDLVRRDANVESVTTLGGHDWRSWSAAKPRLFSSAKAALE